MIRQSAEKRLRLAFTLVELLVVIAIIGVLVGMLLPAVGAVRDAARRTQNANNLKQIGTAIQTYEESKRTYPPLVKRSDYDDPDRLDRAVSWAFELLPFMDQQNIHDRFDERVPVYDPTNAIAMRTPIESYANPRRRDASATAQFAGQPPSARGATLDYAANFGVTVQPLTANLNQSQAALMKSKFDPRLSGPFSLKLAVAQAAVRDGVSNTIGVGDRWIGPALNPMSGEHDQVGLAGASLFSITRFANPEGMEGPIFPLSKADPSVFKFGSPKGSDACFVFLDGHVRWIEYDINAALFRNMCAIADGGTVPSP